MVPPLRRFGYDVRTIAPRERSGRLVRLPPIWWLAAEVTGFERVFCLTIVNRFRTRWRWPETHAVAPAFAGVILDRSKLARVELGIGAHTRRAVDRAGEHQAEPAMPRKTSARTDLPGSRACLPSLRSQAFCRERPAPRAESREERAAWSMSHQIEFTAPTEGIRLRECCLGRGGECSNPIRRDTLYSAASGGVVVSTGRTAGRSAGLKPSAPSPSSSRSRQARRRHLSIERGSG